VTVNFAYYADIPDFMVLVQRLLPPSLSLSTLSSSSPRLTRQTRPTCATQDKAYFYFTSSSVAQVYFDDINLFGGDGTAHYFPTARVFAGSGGGGGGSGGGGSTSAASTLSSALGHLLF
jgi:uncharacterized membrane protein YgcG